MVSKAEINILDITRSLFHIDMTFVSYSENNHLFLGEFTYLNEGSVQFERGLFLEGINGSFME